MVYGAGGAGRKTGSQCVEAIACDLCALGRLPGPTLVTHLERRCFPTRSTCAINHFPSDSEKPAFLRCENNSSFIPRSQHPVDRAHASTLDEFVNKAGAAINVSTANGLCVKRLDP